MSNDAKDAGLVAMISSILGGNKRAEAASPPALAEFLSVAPVAAPFAVVPGLPQAESRSFRMLPMKRWLRRSRSRLLVNP